jgi:ureidoacrylate peracid hydrolase
LDFIEKAREVKLPIIYIQPTYNTKNNYYLSDVWLEQFTRTVKNGAFVKYPVGEPNSWSADFYGGIKPLPGEIVVHKHRYSAFINTDLNLILRSKGIRTLIMSGVASNGCVMATALDGFMMDYYIVYLEDCSATFDEDLHNAALKQVNLLVGEVVNSGDVVRCWEKAKGATYVSSASAQSR